MSKRKSVLAMASTLIWSVAGWSADSGALGLFRIDPTKPGVALFDLPLQVVPPSVANAPYSADEVLEVDRKLPNGVADHRISFSQRIYRDQAGRTRIERPLPWAEGTTAPAVERMVVMLADPVAGDYYVLDTVNRIAHRSKLPPATIAARPMPTGKVETPDSLFEPLGIRESEFGRAEVFRSTMIRDTGGARNSVTETWRLPDLKLVMRIAVKDPVNGNSDSRFLTLKRGEPDYSLFHVPNDYRIVNETGAFSITYPVR